MVILHIANLDDNKSVGPNINVPKNVLYGNKYASVALYNLKKSELAVKLSKDMVFNINEYPNIEVLPKPFNNPDIIIFQGMYEHEQCKFANYARKKNIPYVVVPRCSLTTAGQKHKKLKKKIGNLLFFNKFIRNADNIQFLTNNEYLESKNNFKFKKYFILGNGIEMPNRLYKVKKRKKFKIVFVGRLNVYHKGLDILLNSINENSRWFRENNVKVFLYGLNSDNGFNKILNIINEYKIKDIVNLSGPVFDDKKEKILLDADVFIHTSRLEGQPTAVIEAISYGIPVIVTPGTNIKDIVEQNNLGFGCDFTSKSIFLSIKKSYDNKNKLFSSISNNEIQYAKTNFNWDSIIIKFLKKIK